LSEDLLELNADIDKNMKYVLEGDDDDQKVESMNEKINNNKEENHD